MAKAKRRGAKADKWKKKKIYPVYAPELFERKEVGTTVADDPDKLINRVIKITLRDITGNPMHQFIKLKFRINQVKGEAAYTDFDGFEMMREYIKRNIRRRRSVVRSIEYVNTKDKKLQFTTYTFVARKINTSQKEAIRKKMVEILQKYEGKPLDEVINKALYGQISGEIMKEVKKIAPIHRVEVGKCEVIKK